MCHIRHANQELYAKNDMFYVVQHVDSFQQLFVNKLFQEPPCQTLCCTQTDKRAKDPFVLQPRQHHSELQKCKLQGWLPAPFMTPETFFFLCSQNARPWFTFPSLLFLKLRLCLRLAAVDQSLTCLANCGELWAACNSFPGVIHQQINCIDASPCLDMCFSQCCEKDVQR